MSTVQKTEVLPCGCSHDWQDKRYGKGLRLFIVVINSGKFDKITKRCTVCRKEK